MVKEHKMIAFIWNARSLGAPSYQLILYSLSANLSLLTYCVSAAGGKMFNRLPLETGKIESRTAFTSFLNKYSK